MSRDFTRGSSQYLSNANAAVAGTPLTMACWFKFDNHTNDQALMSVGKNAANDHRHTLAFIGGANDLIRITTRATTANAIANTTSTYTPNTWGHACTVIASATDRKVYLNGGNEGADTTPQDPTGMDSTFIGAQHGSSPTNFADGLIAEAGIWNVALNTSEVAALARGVSPLRIRPANLVAYWSLFGIGSPEPDYRGGFHLTLNNAPTQADHAPVAPMFFVADWAGAFTAAGGGSINLSAVIAGNSSTTAATLNVDRTLSALSGWQSSTENADVVVDRAISSTSAWQSSTTTPVLEVARALAAVSAWQSSTPTADIVIDRSVSASSDWQSSTPGADIVIDRQLLGSSAWQSSTPAADIVVTRPLLATSVWQSSTSDAEILVGLLLTATIGMQTSTTQGDLVVDRSLSTLSNWVSNTDPATLVIDRSISSVSSWQSSTPGATLVVNRLLLSTSAWQSSTSDATLALLIALVAGINGQTSTGAAELTVARALQSLSAWQGSTGTATLNVSRLLAALILMQSSTSAAVLDTGILAAGIVRATFILKQPGAAVTMKRPSITIEKE